GGTPCRDSKLHGRFSLESIAYAEHGEPRSSCGSPTRNECGSGDLRCAAAAKADSVEARERLVPTRVETLTLVGNCTSRLNTPPLVVKTLASNPPVRLRLAARLVLNSPLL